MNISNAFSKLKKSKGICYLAIGILAAVILSLIPTSSAEPTKNESSSIEYRRMLETETKALLCRIDGVKDCSVIITLASGFEYTYASDKYTQQRFYSDGTPDTIEAKSEIFAPSDGNALQVKEKMPQVAGVAVVCNGADAATRLKIISLLSALFDVGSDRISVQA